MAEPSDEPTDEPTVDGGDQRDEDASDHDGPTGDQAPADGETLADDEYTDETATSPSDVSAYTTDERTITSTVQLIWGVRALAGVTVLTLVAGFVATRFGVDLTYVLGGGVALAVVALVWVHLRYRVWAYRVREDALYLERGVVTHVKTVAPYVRIQHVDTQRGPFERALGLSTLVVYTAGSRGADVSIPGLRTDVAADLQQRVKELAIESEGGDAL